MLAGNGLSKPLAGPIRGLTSPPPYVPYGLKGPYTKYGTSPKPQSLVSPYSSLLNQVEDSSCRVLDGVSVLALRLGVWS